MRNPALLLTLGGVFVPLDCALAADPSDSARAVDLHFGNALDPLGWAGALRLPDDDGLSLLHPDMLRTPSGALYPYPSAPREFESMSGAWSYDAIFGAGYAGTLGDDDAQWFRQYADWDDDFITQFSLDLERADTGDYLEFRGSRLNENNQFYRLRAGRAGEYRIEAFHRDIPHVISTTAHPLWEGVGNETLTLPGSLTPGGSTVAEIAAASDAAPRETIRVDRSRNGVSIEGDLTNRWIGYLSLTNEERQGTRLWGGSMFFNYPFADNGGINETVRPIDFTTTDVGLGARFVGQAWRINTVYSGSFFRNHKDRLDYQSPFMLSTVLGPAVPPAGVISQGQFSLEPDNDYHNLRVELARSLPSNGELSFAVAAGTMRQDDSLLAPTTCNGLGGIFIAPPADYTFNCADWNTTAALSQTSADARIDTQMIDVRVVFRPTPAFGWHAGLKHYAEDNKTQYLAYNPITGQYGYISENGSQGSIVPGEIGIFDSSNPLYSSYVVSVRNAPYEYQQTVMEIGGDWQLGEKQTLDANYTFDRNEPEHRERDRVDDQRLTLAWTYRMPTDATLRVSYEIADRSGDSYNYDPYDPFFSNSLPGFVTPAGGVTAHTVEEMRKYDLADRRQNKVRAILIQPVGNATTVSATVYGNYNDYDATIGRRGTWTTGTTLQWDFQPAPEITVNAYAGYDYSHLRFANVADDESNLTADPSLGGATYPLANRWSEDDREDSYNAGLTFRRDFGRCSLDVAYSFVYTQGEIGYSYASLAAISPTQQPFPDAIGSQFPENHYRAHTLDLGLTATFTTRLSARFFGRYEAGDFADFHYDGFEDSLVYDHRVYTDVGPVRKYGAGLIGVMLNYKL